ncbi:translocation protein SEC63 homolog [Glandiceps talaboti]
MARAQFVYDESGGAFLYFVVSVYALVLIPLTYLIWPSKEKKEDPDKLSKQCHCEPCENKRGRLKNKDPRAHFKVKFRKIFLFAAWIIFIILAYKASQVKTETVEFDPYEVLQIDRGATTGEIRKKYRQLSKVHHPDKGGDHLTFMKIAKAYEALTDEEAKKNWEEHGNPDGPQATSFGIALPAWIVEKQNSVWVLAAYGIAFMVVLPAAVGTWWYRSIKFSADQILLDTTQLFFYFFHKTQNMAIKRAMMVLTAAWEFEKGHNAEIQYRPSDNEEVPMLIRDLSGVNEKVKEKPMCYPYAIKARALLHAYLAKKELNPKTLHKDLEYMLKKGPMLVNEMISVCSQLFHYANAGRVQPGREPRLETFENCMKLSQMIVQRSWEHKSPLLQLPHFNDDVLRHCITRKRNIRNLRALAGMKEADRRALLRNLEDDKYNDVMNVLNSMPHVEMDVRSEVLDDEDGAHIGAGDIVTVTVTLTRKTLEFFQHDDINEDGIGEEDEQERNDSPKPTKNKPKVWEKQRKGKKNKPKKGKQQPAKKPVKKAVQQNKTNQVNRVQDVHGKEQNQESDDESNRHSDADAESDSEDNSRDRHSNRSSDSEDDAPRPNDDEDDDEDGEEDDWDGLQANITRREKVLEAKSKLTHEVHSPFYPEEKQEWWWVYIADKKKRTLLTTPTQICTLRDEEETQIKFQAPPRPGQYQYHVCLRSDSYFDLDVQKQIKLDVHEAKQVEESHPQWDISDEDDNRNDSEDEMDYTTDDEGSDQDE